MNKIRIGWTSDWHIRNSQYARKSRGEDFAKAVIACTQEMCDAGCDVLVNAGDIFNVSRPSPENVKTLMHVNAILCKNKQRMLCITGNHDMVHPTWLSTLFPGDNDDRYGIVPLDDKVIDVNGVTFGNIKPVTTNVFKELVANDTLPTCDVFVYHILVNDFIGFDDAKQLCIEDFPKDKYSAILLGDIHVADTRKHGNTLIGYPGSVEMCSSSEDTNKSFTVVEIEDGNAEVVSRPNTFPTRTYITDVIKTEEDLDALILRLRDACDEDPVIVVKYDPAVRSTIPRVFGAVDASKAVIKLTALPASKIDLADIRDASSAAEELPLSHFVLNHFEDATEDMKALALQLADNPDIDVYDAVTTYIEKRKDEINKNKA